MSRLDLYLFGTPRAEIDGLTVNLERRKASALLAYLALTNQPHNRDALAALLWPDYDQAGARTALRQVLKALKTALGGTWLVADWETISLGCDGSLWIDVEHFRSLLAQCRAHDHADDEVCERCLTPLAQAVEIYRDHFLAGFTLTDSPDFDEWQFHQADQLRNMLITALDHLVRGYSTQHEFQAAIGYAHRLQSLDLLHEPAYRYLMQLYTWTDQRQTALRQYEECLRALAEIDITPQPATTELYEAIKTGEILPQTSSIGLRFNIRLPVHRHNLPKPPTPFLSRDEELAQISAHLDDENCRLLTLVGLGGIGKTRLAIQAALNKADQFAHGVHFVSLAALTSHDFLAPAIAMTLQFSFQDGNNPRTQLLNYLAEKELLLVLDNFEHILDGADLVTEILAIAPGVKILATSRERLQLQEEWLLPVEGMNYPRDQMAEAIEDYGAVQLFFQNARRLQAGFSLRENRLAVARICQLVEGMPLAIELSAGWLWMMSCDEIADEIQRNLDFFETTLRNVPQRHRSLRVVFEHSWNLLTDGEKTGLLRLTVFRGGFTLDAAQKVAETPQNVLDMLADKSLIRLDESDRYDIHEMLRQYVAEKLRAEPEHETATHNRHCAYYTDFIGQRQDRLQNADLQSARDEIQHEIENIRVAWTWAARNSKYAELSEGLIAFAIFYRLQAWYSEGIAAFEDALNYFELTEQSDRSEQLLWARLQARRGWFSLMINQWKQGEAFLQESLAIARRLDSLSDIAFALNRLAYSTFQQTNYSAAKALLEESSLVCESANDAQELAFALTYLAAALERQSQFEAAIQQFAASLNIARELGNYFTIGEALLGLGNVHLAQGAHAKARVLFEETLVTHRTIGHPHLIAQSLSRLGWTAFRQGDYAAARPFFADALEIDREIGSRLGIANELNALGAVAYAEKAYGDAQVIFEESLTLYRELGVRGAAATVLGNLGGIYLALAQYADAERLFKECLQIHEQTGNRRWATNALNNLGKVACARGDYPLAENFLRQSLAAAKEINATALLIEIIVNMAVLFAAKGDNQSALALIGVALAQPGIDQTAKEDAVTLLEKLGATIEQVTRQPQMMETTVTELLR